MTQSNSLLKKIKKFKNYSIIVIGDIILDEYIYGRVERISPEAPVPVVLVKNTTYHLGGAANVSLNLRSLGAKVSLFGVIGKDNYGEMVLDILKEKGIETRGIFSSPDRPTTIKTRVVAHSQQMLRIDRENDFNVPAPITRRLTTEFENTVNSCNGIIIQDYEKGVLSHSVIKKVLEFSGRKMVAVDPKFQNFFRYNGVSIFKPNLRELEGALNRRLRTEEEILVGILKIGQKINAEDIVLTMGEAGMFVMDGKNHRINHIPSLNLEVYDVTGAGDTVIALLALSKLAGCSRIQSAIIASIGAGIEVGKFGHSSINLDELVQGIRAYGDSLLKRTKVR